MHGIIKTVLSSLGHMQSFVNWLYSNVICHQISKLTSYVVSNRSYSMKLNVQNSEVYLLLLENVLSSYIKINLLDHHIHSYICFMGLYQLPFFYILIKLVVNIDVYIYIIYLYIMCIYHILSLTRTLHPLNISLQKW